MSSNHSGRKLRKDHVMPNQNEKKQSLDPMTAISALLTMHGSDNYFYAFILGENGSVSGIQSYDNSYKNTGIDKLVMAVKSYIGNSKNYAIAHPADIMGNGERSHCFVVSHNNNGHISSNIARIENNVVSTIDEIELADNYIFKQIIKPE